MDEIREIYVRSKIVKLSADVSGRIIFADDNFLTITGYLMNEIDGMFTSDILSSCAMSGICQDAIMKVVRDKVWTGNVPFKAKDGKIVWLFGTIFPKYSPDGTISEIAGEFIMCSTHEIHTAKEEVLKKYGVECE